MKITIDTSSDSLDDLKALQQLLADCISRRQGGSQQTESGNVFGVLEEPEQKEDKRRYDDFVVPYD